MLIGSSDYNGFIIEVKEDSIIIITPTPDAMDDYPTYEIFFDEHTEIESTRDSMNKFSAGDEVRVWIQEKGEAKKLATKIIIDVYGNDPSSTGMR